MLRSHFGLKGLKLAKRTWETYLPPGQQCRLPSPASAAAVYEPPGPAPTTKTVVWAGIGIATTALSQGRLAISLLVFRSISTIWFILKGVGRVRMPGSVLQNTSLLQLFRQQSGTHKRKPSTSQERLIKASEVQILQAILCTLSPEVLKDLVYSLKCSWSVKCVSAAKDFPSESQNADMLGASDGVSRDTD